MYLRVWCLSTVPCMGDACCMHGVVGYTYTLVVLVHR